MAVVRRWDRILGSIRAPAALAKQYREINRLNGELFANVGRLRRAGSRGNLNAVRRLELEGTKIGWQARVLAGEVGLWGCTGDLPPERFLARSAAQRVIARLDQACAPAAATYDGIGVDEVVTTDLLHSGKMTLTAARKQTAIDFYNDGDFARYAATSLAQLRVPARSERTLQDLISGLQDSSAIFSHNAQQLTIGEPIDSTTFDREVQASIHRVALDGRRLGAGECAQL